ncbi:MAG: PHB depolymerase family esterase [Acidobacteriota bacterium]
MMPILRMLPLFTAAAALAAGLGPGDHRRTLQHGGIERSYIVHVPPGYDGSKLVPVVLNFHGGGGNARVHERFSGMNEKADAAGFVVVYPNGTGRGTTMLTWNGGNCCMYAMFHRIDDVGFTSAMLDDLEKVLAVDTKRIFATGMSNGAIMCHRLACELSDRIAAIAPVAGTLGVVDCSPSRPVPVIDFHGTDDPYLKYTGGFGEHSITKTLFESVPRTIERWVEVDGCPGKPVRSTFPNTADDGTTVVKETYGPGKNGAEVVLVTIEGGGHTWPGRAPRLPDLGASTRDVSANDLMWEFFQAHPMP